MQRNLNPICFGALYPLVTAKVHCSKIPYLHEYNKIFFFLVICASKKRLVLYSSSNILLAFFLFFLNSNAVVPGTRLLLLCLERDQRTRWSTLGFLQFRRRLLPNGVAIGYAVLVTSPGGPVWMRALLRAWLSIGYSLCFVLSAAAF